MSDERQTPYLDSLLCARYDGDEYVCRPYDPAHHAHELRQLTALGITGTEGIEMGHLLPEGVRASNAGGAIGPAESQVLGQLGGELEELG